MALKDSELVAIDNYIARKQYDKAVELLERLYRSRPEEIQVRMKLADAYFLYGRTSRAIVILEELAEDYARRGFITKAMAVQKKIKRFDPGAKIDVYQYAQEGIEKTPPGPPTKPKEEPRKEETESSFRILDGIFSGLSRAEFNELIELLNERTVEKGEVVIKEGAKDDSLFIIISGKVKVITSHKNRDVELAILEAGDFFGEVALLTKKKRTASIVAEESCSLLEMSRSNFDVLSDSYPQLRHTLETALERRAAATVERLLAVELDEGV